MMKLITLTVPEREYDATVSMLHTAAHHGIHDADTCFGSKIMAFDSDLLPTTNLNDARWLYSDNHYACSVVKIGNDGTMMQLKRGDD